MPRKANVTRKTKETDITALVCLDGSGKSVISTPVPFFNHMLDLFCMHGGFDIELKASGDSEIDGHHTVEDIGIVLGGAFKKAAGGKEGIERFGFSLMPMGESLVTLSLDVCGRSVLVWNCGIKNEKVGNFDVELVHEFLKAFCDNFGLTLHVNLNYGQNTHHILEAVFKALGRSLRKALAVADGSGGVPSTKGTL